uniref:Uncharacterized protein n=1 Tax=Timema genevievae TaxID=629358 RepID=A0A7R9K058_TIMGE|nr:unnamed protein product [Timema genevievae]
MIITVVIWEESGKPPLSKLDQDSNPNLSSAGQSNTLVTPQSIRPLKWTIPQPESSMHLPGVGFSRSSVRLLVLTSFYLLFLVLGASIFSAIEGPEEVQLIRQLRHMRLQFLKHHQCVPVKMSGLGRKTSGSEVLCSDGRKTSGSKVLCSGGRKHPAPRSYVVVVEKHPAPRSYVVVVEKHPAPRSYVVKDSRGDEYRRNSKGLTLAAKQCTLYRKCLDACQLMALLQCISSARTGYDRLRDDVNSSGWTRAHVRQVLGVRRSSALLLVYVMFYLVYLVTGGLVFTAMEAPEEQKLQNMLSKSRRLFLDNYPCVSGRVSWIQEFLRSGLGVLEFLGSGLGIQEFMGSGLGVQEFLGSGLGIQEFLGSGLGIQEFMGSGLGIQEFLGSGLGVQEFMGSGLGIQEFLGSGLGVQEFLGLIDNSAPWRSHALSLPEAIVHEQWRSTLIDHYEPLPHYLSLVSGATLDLVNFGAVTAILVGLHRDWKLSTTTI